MYTFRGLFAICLLLTFCLFRNGNFHADFKTLGHFEPFRIDEILRVHISKINSDLESRVQKLEIGRNTDAVHIARMQNQMEDLILQINAFNDKAHYCLNQVHDIKNTLHTTCRVHKKVHKNTTNYNEHNLEDTRNNSRDGLETMPSGLPSTGTRISTSEVHFPSDLRTENRGAYRNFTTFFDLGPSQKQNSGTQSKAPNDLKLKKASTVPLGRLTTRPRVVPTSSIIAFHVVLSHSYAPLTDLTVAYNHKLLDISDGYDPTKGLYTVPESGVYVLTWTTLTQQAYIQTILQVNGNTRGRSFSDSFQGTELHSATGVVVIQLNACDHVLIGISSHYAGTYLMSNLNYEQPSFSGWKLN